MCGDDDVAASQQRGVARETASADNADERHLSRSTPCPAAAKASASSPVTTAMSVSPGRPPPPGGRARLGGAFASTSSNRRAVFGWFIWLGVLVRTKSCIHTPGKPRKTVLYRRGAAVDVSDPRHQTVGGRFGQRRSSVVGRLLVWPRVMSAPKHLLRGTRVAQIPSVPWAGRGPTSAPASAAAGRPSSSVAATRSRSSRTSGRNATVRARTSVKPRVRRRRR